MIRPCPYTTSVPGDLFGFSRPKTAATMSSLMVISVSGSLYALCSNVGVVTKSFFVNVIQCMFSSEFCFIYGILYSSSEQRGGIASCTTMTVTLKPTLNLNLPLYLKAG